MALEERCFTLDRISRRSFRHLLTKGHAACIVAEAEGRIAGYALLLFSKGTALARLYSIAVDPQDRRRGFGSALLAAAEQAALDAGAVELRLEVRPDNEGAVAQYRAAGYRPFGSIQDYYEDHADALRMAKRLAGGNRVALRRVPYYAQTLPFTCGAASLMMAFRALDPDAAFDRRKELRLWREATLIYMTSGHGGCDPFGLSLAAQRRGFGVELFVTEEERLFVDSVRDPQKKEVIRLVLQDFRSQARKSGIVVHRRGIQPGEMVAALDRGAIPVVLISSYALTGEKAPHWVALTGHDERFVYFHDPDPTRATARGGKLDCVNVPVPREAFARMSRYGMPRLRAAVVLGSGGAGQDALPMVNYVVIVEGKGDEAWAAEHGQVVTARDYVTRPSLFAGKRPRVINLNGDLDYMAEGYYCSLLAEARDHKVIPTVQTIVELSKKTLYSDALPDLNAQLRRDLDKLEQPPRSGFTLTLFFGEVRDNRFRNFARAVFDRFRCPILKVACVFDERWRIGEVKVVTPSALAPDEFDFFLQALAGYTRTGWRAPKSKTPPRYSLAILQNPREAMPPSDREALAKFVQVGAGLGVGVELIERKDFLSLAEYDALFIRETTTIDNHTYRFALKAVAEGMPVIDDPVSMLRCTNKVFLAELLQANKLPAPQTLIIDRENLEEAERALGYPHGAEDPGRVLLARRLQGGEAAGARRACTQAAAALRRDPGAAVHADRVRLAGRRAEPPAALRFAVLHESQALADHQPQQGRQAGRGRLEDLVGRAGAEGGGRGRPEGRQPDRRWPLRRRPEADQGRRRLHHRDQRQSQHRTRMRGPAPEGRALSHHHQGLYPEDRGAMSGTNAKLAILALTLGLWLPTAVPPIAARAEEAKVIIAPAEEAAPASGAAAEGEEADSDEDRHSGYYYPPLTTQEEYVARAQSLLEANRSVRVAFVTGLALDQAKRGYPLPYALFAKGSEAEKLIVVALIDGPFDTLYRARAMLTNLTAEARLLPLIKDNGVEDWFTFYDLAVLLGFTQITVSDGKSWTHQVTLLPPP